jgi:hypothetical protein
VEKPEIIKDFLLRAQLAISQKTDLDKIDFQIGIHPKNPSLWIKVFHEVF